MLNFYSEDRELFTFDDVLLVPQYNEIKSRQDVDLSTGGHLKLRLPIISANMDTVTESQMAIALAKAGGLGILHRFMSKEKLHHEATSVYETAISSGDFGNGFYNLALSLGVNDRKQMHQVLELGPNVICIDVAHGHAKSVMLLIENMREIMELSNRHQPKIIAGNVATREGVRFLAKAGADIIKVGIGPGSLCSTRVVTGHGFPQLSAIDSCAEEADILTAELGRSIEIISDGGARSSGDIAKCLAAGANYVMIGSLLAATDETPGEVVKIEGKKFKQYRGMASREVQKELGKTAAAEGVSQLKELAGPVSDVLKELEGGLRSALTYSGAVDLSDFRIKAKFIRVSSATQLENIPHGLHA